MQVSFIILIISTVYAGLRPSIQNVHVQNGKVEVTIHTDGNGLSLSEKDKYILAICKSDFTNHFTDDSLNNCVIKEKIKVKKQGSKEYSLKIKHVDLHNGNYKVCLFKGEGSFHSLVAEANLHSTTNGLNAPYQSHLGHSSYPVGHFSNPLPSAEYPSIYPVENSYTNPSYPSVYNGAQNYPQPPPGYPTGHQGGYGNTENYLQPPPGYPTGHHGEYGNTENYLQPPPGYPTQYTSHNQPHPKKKKKKGGFGEDLLSGAAMGFGAGAAMDFVENLFD